MALPAELSALVRRHPRAEVDEFLVDRFHAWLEGAQDETMDWIVAWLDEAKAWQAAKQETTAKEASFDLDDILADLAGYDEKPRYRVKAISERWAA